MPSGDGRSDREAKAEGGRTHEAALDETLAGRRPANGARGVQRL
jgi:hypothetical protein